MKKILHLSIFIFLFICSNLYGQKVLVKTNLLYAASSTPNLGMSLRLSDKQSFSLHGGYNPFQFGSGFEASGVKVNRKLKHWVAMGEWKYWFCKTFERSYIGVHGVYGGYNLGGFNFSEEFEKHRYSGSVYGAGVSYGYHWALGSRWGLDASLGAGYLHFDYTKYRSGRCGANLGRYTRNYWGLTKASVSVLFFLQ